MNDQINEVIEYMSELEQDSNVPRNIKAKLNEITKLLKKAEKKDLSLTINRLLSDLDDVSGDANLDQFTRQQIWSITSMLEGLDTD